VAGGDRSEELLAECARLIAENATFAAENARLLAENAELRALVDRLEARVAELEHRQGRNSGNSSLPPSRDDAEARAAQAAKRQSKRTKSGRRQGKQPGAPGAHLRRVDDPDRMVRHVPTTCRCCGAGLADAPVTGSESRQVFDLPERRAQVTDHVVERRRCGCGAETKAEFPPAATAPACFGPAVRAAGVYLLVRQHIPVARAAEILTDLLGVPVSVGWLSSLISEAADGLGDFVEDLTDALADEPVAGADETSVRVAGAKWWFHVVCTALLTFLGVHPNRGLAATDDLGVLPRFKGILVHDRWAPYWHYQGMAHAICNAHVLRDLAAAAEIATQKPWADAMAELLVDAKRRTDAARAAGRVEIPAHRRARIRANYDAIIAVALAANPEPPDNRKRTRTEKIGYNLAVALRDHKHEVLRFTEDLAVSFDNNQSERDLRMARLQTKVSGCFRSESGACGFATVRSYIETGRKHDTNPFDILLRLFQGNPWTIPRSMAIT
jgi:transposase